MIAPGYTVSNSANWYFMAISAILLTVVGAWVTDHIVEPRLQRSAGEQPEAEEPTEEHHHSLRNAGISLLLFAAVMVPVCRALGMEMVLGAGLIPVIFLGFGVPCVVHGLSNGTFSGSKDIIDAMAKSYQGMASYIVMCFFAAQFIGFFEYSNLGTIISVKLAALLNAYHITGIPLALTFIVMVCLINLFMGSSSVKWSILAPIFVPVLMVMGYSPEFTQLMYRIGDSSTNIISPLMGWFPMLLVFMKRYQKEASVGTLIASMLPYSLAFLVFWSLQLCIWMVLELPIGPSGGR